MRRVSVAVVLLVLVLVSASCVAQTQERYAWQAKVRQQLPLLGHRNWILIVDSAYPLQTSPGVETIDTQLPTAMVLHAVLADLSRERHVRPVVFLDKELEFVPAEDYRDVRAYREDLHASLKPYPVESLLHEEILRRISEEAKTYKVLVLKTKMLVPYTSVFLRLDCKYLNEEGEQKIRRAMKAAAK